MCVWKRVVSLCLLIFIANLVRFEIAQEIEVHPGHVCEGSFRELAKARAVVGAG